jgi:DNA-binding response OmpR family regulator
MKHVLLVDCDRQVLTARGDELAADAFEPMLAASAPAARVKLPDAEVLILGRLESVSAALGLVRDLRAGHIAAADRALAVLTIGADRDHELVRHYQAGADLALPSDASPLLVSAGVHALAGRRDRERASTRVRVGNLTIGLDNGTAMVADRPLRLSNREFARRRRERHGQNPPRPRMATDSRGAQRPDRRRVPHPPVTAPPRPQLHPCAPADRPAALPVSEAMTGQPLGLTRRRLAGRHHALTGSRATL